MPESTMRLPTPQVWPVGVLCLAIADALSLRFNPVAVSGEVTGFSRAASGHCYFTLKDDSGQLRCALFRRSASALDFSPAEGMLVEVHGRLGVYAPRGDLQLVVEHMARAGRGVLFEQYLKLKAKLAAEGLFEPSTKRTAPLAPRGIGVVTSLDAAAWHDVVVALQRRVPHIPVVLAAASVQGQNAPAELMAALSSLYALAAPAPKLPQPQTLTPVRSSAASRPVIDVILLVRGGGAIEDLWAFNSEPLVRLMAQSPVPIICGVGHETDFTLADFVADVRAPTPTAAAELAAQPREVWLTHLQSVAHHLKDAVLQHLDLQNQRLDINTAKLGRPSSLVTQQHLGLSAWTQRLKHAAALQIQQRRQKIQHLEDAWPFNVQRSLAHQQNRLDRAALRLELLDPTLVLQRGYALLSTIEGQTITSARAVRAGQRLWATLADGAVELDAVAVRVREGNSANPHKPPDQ